ncbi:MULTISPECIES: GNAT family N-acetyltransferase [Methylosinus]|uniref:GNAT family N-acetyltransferase n=1 Tax=Methylosinus trichosporium (strain ATCC 35070 / NCIMB 11131 / UNIQEM 75 / OB3b) TaxID=595536 RepID=A0A2D2CX44_METT3|nr:MULTISPECIES: GNAT family N-acetyltransferase [Methylosinus]ATQ67264.1 GNAT family N-acetyltransferase [Methylosinus trichosporium OB3b]OBS52581.1 acyl-CoA acyltransferase [Methylosinus sp. 3S-1]
MVNAIDCGVTTVSRAAAPARLALDIFTRLEDARADWSELFVRAPASPYQSYDFCRLWLETLGRAQGLAPMIVVARTSAGRPLALLPLAQGRVGPLRVARFIGGRDSNLNAALIDRDAALGDPRTLLRRAARMASVDLFVLRNQPTLFAGAANPLAFPGSSASPSFAHARALPAAAADLDARLSGDARKKLRKKKARLEALGALAFEHNASGRRARDIAEALIAQKAERLRGVDRSFEQEEMRDFILRLSETGALEIHALTLDGRIIAAYAGLAHERCFSAMLNSFIADEEIARSSPGDLLLHALMRDLVARGFTRFDLGIGEARYKDAVCDETIVLVDTIIPTRSLGFVAAPLLVAATQAKRKIKQTPILLAWAARLRGFRPPKRS